MNECLWGDAEVLSDLPGECLEGDAEVLSDFHKGKAKNCPVLDAFENAPRLLCLLVLDPLAHLVLGFKNQGFRHCYPLARMVCGVFGHGICRITGIILQILCC